MNQRPLNEIVREAVARIREEPDAPGNVDGMTERVLQDPDMKIILDGYDMHDRSEGLEDVIIRDVRRMVERALEG